MPLPLRADSQLCCRTFHSAPSPRTRVTVPDVCTASMAEQTTQYVPEMGCIHRPGHSRYCICQDEGLPFRRFPLRRPRQFECVPFRIRTPEIHRRQPLPQSGQGQHCRLRMLYRHDFFPPRPKQARRRQLQRWLAHFRPEYSSRLARQQYCRQLPRQRADLPQCRHFELCFFRGEQ